MAGKSSRNKGARGEREVIALLQPIVDRVCEEANEVSFVLKRNYSQRFAKKQYDVEGIPWMALEVKRHESTVGIAGWWRQTLEATRKGQVPVLMWRQNNGPWKVRTKMIVETGGPRMRTTVDMKMSDWLLWFELKLRASLIRGARKRTR